MKALWSCKTQVLWSCIYRVPDIHDAKGLRSQAFGAKQCGTKTTGTDMISAEAYSTESSTAVWLKVLEGICTFRLPKACACFRCSWVDSSPPWKLHLCPGMLLWTWCPAAPKTDLSRQELRTWGDQANRKLDKFMDDRFVNSCWTE